MRLKRRYTNQVQCALHRGSIGSPDLVHRVISMTAFPVPRIVYTSDSRQMDLLNIEISCSIQRYDSCLGIFPMAVHRVENRERLTDAAAIQPGD